MRKTRYLYGIPGRVLGAFRREREALRLVREYLQGTLSKRLA